MPQFKLEEYIYLIPLLLAVILLCFVGLGDYPVFILDEAKNAEAAREMYVRSDWIIPTFNNELRTDKPVFHYWAMMLAYKIFGVSAFSARFFSAVFGIFTLFSAWYYTRRFLGSTSSALTLLVLASSLFFVQEFHLAVPDPYLIFFISFGLFNFYEYHRHEKRLSLFLFYTSLGAGVLVKGPVAVLLPGLAIVVFLLSTKKFDLSTLKKYRIFLGGLLILIIALPWYLLVHDMTEGAFSQGFFLQHNLGRFTSEMEGHGGLPFVTLGFVVLGLFPFSFFLLQGVMQGWKLRKDNEFIFFCLIVSLVFIGFFSLSSTKLPNYPMPSYPFVAVLIAAYLQAVLKSSEGFGGYRVSLWLLLLVSVALPPYLYFVLTKVEAQLSGQSWVSLVLVPLGVGSLLALVFDYTKRTRLGLLTLGISSMVTATLLFTQAYPALVSQSPVVLAKEMIAPDTKVIIYKNYDPALLFNIERTFEVTDSRQRVEDFLDDCAECLAITKTRTLNKDFADYPAEILLNQKALFEGYRLSIFKKMN